jgi:hypothetical protein
MPIFVSALQQKVRNCATMPSSPRCLSHLTGSNRCDFRSLARMACTRSGSSGGIVSGLRLICIAALAALAPAAAAAQTATAGDKPGNAYLAGLRPPHDQHKPAHLKTIQKTNHLAERTPAAKTTPLATQRQVAVAAKAKAHRPVRLAQKSLAEKINARVAWPNLNPGVEPGVQPGVEPSLGPRVEPTAVEPAAADERTDTALQFTTEDTKSGVKSVAPPALRSTMSASPNATKPAPPPTIAATERKADPTVVETTPTATMPVQTEPSDPPPPSQMRVIMPAPNSDPIAAPTPSDPPPPSSSSTAQTLATLAGAIAAGIVAWFMIGSRRIARSRQI